MTSATRDHCVRTGVPAPPVAVAIDAVGPVAAGRHERRAHPALGAVHAEQVRRAQRRRTREPRAGAATVDDEGARPARGAQPDPPRPAPERQTASRHHDHRRRNSPARIRTPFPRRMALASPRHTDGGGTRPARTRSFRSSTSWPSSDGGSDPTRRPAGSPTRQRRDVPVAAGAQLPPLRLRATRLADRDVDAARRTGLAGAPADELGHRTRRGHRAPVRAAAAAGAVGRRGGRPRRQAQDPARNAERHRADGAGARPARRVRSRGLLACTRPGRRARAGDSHRHPGAAVLRRRDGRQGRPCQRRRDQLDDLQCRTHPRPGRCGGADRRHRHRLAVHRQRGLEPCRPARPGPDAPGRAVRGAAPASRPRPAARGLHLRARASGSHHHDGC